MGSPTAGQRPGEGKGRPKAKPGATARPAAATTGRPRSTASAKAAGGSSGRKTGGPRSSQGSTKPRTKKRSSSAQRRTKPPRRGLTWLKRILVSVLLVGLVGSLAGAVGLIVAYQRIEMPDPNREFITEASQVVFRDGITPLGDFAEQNRIRLTYAEIPRAVKDAVVAAENREFWTDPGISVSGILRAAKNIIAGEPLQSGSTITQQYIKLVYLTADQTPSRKIKEILLSIKMSRGGEMTKQDILTGYLNAIWFGRGAYGIQAAAQAYFSVDAQDLTVPQSIALAGILNSPGYLDPADEDNRTRFEERYEYVLDGMVTMGALTPDEAAAAAQPPEFPEVPTSDRYGGPNGFLLKAVEEELVDTGQFTEENIQGDGLTIITTFDAAAQEAAVQSVQSWTQKVAETSPTQDPTQLHGGLASVEVGTGEVLALYGGPDYVASQWNWATTHRISGSTFKTYVLAAALEQGFTLNTMLNGNTFTPTGDSAPIRNAGGAQFGRVTLAKATASSINTAYVDLTQQMTDGAAQTVVAAEAAGVPRNSSWVADNRIALGRAEVSPLDQASGYATFANNGAAVSTHVVREVWDEGKLVYTASTEPRIAFPADVASTVTHALRDVITQGTGSTAAAFPYPTAGKTGTGTATPEGSNKELTVSSWFVAYTRQVSTAVMFVCGDDAMGDLDEYVGGSFKGSYTANIWLDYMAVAMAGRDKTDFDKPQNPGPTESPTPEPSPSATAADEPTPSSAPPSSAPPSLEPEPSPPADPSPDPMPSPDTVVSPLAVPAATAPS